LKNSDQLSRRASLLFLLPFEAIMSAHAFEVLSRARNEIAVCHTAEGHRSKCFVVTNAHGRRILSESVEIFAKEGTTHTPEFFPAVLALSPSRWPIGLTQFIEFIRVDGVTEVEGDSDALKHQPEKTLPFVTKLSVTATWQF
jgi:hypothetical protein